MQSEPERFYSNLCIACIGDPAHMLEHTDYLSDEPWLPDDIDATADDLRDFHIHESREINNCEIYAWLFNLEGGGFWMYLDGPATVLSYMGWPYVA